MRLRQTLLAVSLWGTQLATSIDAAVIDQERALAAQTFWEPRTFVLTASSG